MTHGGTAAVQEPGGAVLLAPSEAVAEGPVAVMRCGDALGRAASRPTQPTGDQPTNQERINSVHHGLAVGGPRRCTAG